MYIHRNRNKKGPADKEKTFHRGERFFPIRQGPIINEFIRLGVGGWNAHTEFMSAATPRKTIITAGAVTVTITDDIQIAPIDLFLFVAILRKDTAKKLRDRDIMIPLKVYRQWRGLKSIDRLRVQALQALGALESAYVTITQTEWKRGKPYKKKYEDVKLIETGAEIKNGMIIARLTKSLRRILVTKGAPYSGMPFPAPLLTINPKYNPNSFFFGWKLATLKFMNYGKPNEDTVSVRTLLESTPELPIYDKIIKTEWKQVRQRIIDPFIRDMGALIRTGILSEWAFYDDEGYKLTDDDVRRMSYAEFLRLNVKVTWIDYPDQTERLQRKAEKVEEEKQREAEREERKQRAQEAKNTKPAAAKEKSPGAIIEIQAADPGAGESKTESETKDEAPAAAVGGG